MANPFVTNWSPIVKNSQCLSLDDLDSEKYTFSASLPDACQELYNNVLSCKLDCDSDPYPLSDAIEYSINTEGALLWTTLKNKDEFDDPTQIYLRVTLGPDRGKSAGIPYVLKIWPSQCGCPIHNHSNCYAVINFIHGAIDIEIFNKPASDHDSTNHIMKFTATRVGRPGSRLTGSKLTGCGTAHRHIVLLSSVISTVKLTPSTGRTLTM